MSNWMKWLHGLGAAFIGAFATAASGAITLPNVFSFTHSGMINFAKVCTVPAMLSAFAYLKQSPLPSSETTVIVTASQTVTETPKAE